MIRLFPMKMPVKNYSDVDWFKQVKNTELTRSCIISVLCSWRTFLIVSKNCRCKRKTHELVNAQRCVFVCVCVCVCTYIDMAFRDNTFQAANMFSVTNSRCFKSNCEFTVNSTSCFLKASWTVWGNWKNYFWKFENTNLTLISWHKAAFGNLDANNYCS